jgi:hypothetical protein
MSKFTKANKKIEDTVVSGYKAIENSVVSGYKKIEDKFVEAFLTPDGVSEKADGGADVSEPSMSEAVTSKEILENGLLTGLNAIENSVSVGFKAIKNAIASE